MKKDVDEVKELAERIKIVMKSDQNIYTLWLPFVRELIDRIEALESQVARWR